MDQHTVITNLDSNFPVTRTEYILYYYDNSKRKWLNDDDKYFFI